MRSCAPDCEPSGILSLCGSSSVGISISAPSAACAIFSGIVQCRSYSWRWKNACSLTLSTKYGWPGGAGAGLGGFAAAMLARLGARHLDLGGHAEDRLFELNLGIVADILAALRPGAPPRAARRAEQIAEAEKVTQNVAEVEIVGVEALRRALHALMPVAVVCRALLGVAQNAICLGRLFEFFLGGMIARIHVRVAFPRQLAVGALDLLIVCVPAYPQDFVVVSFRHGHGSEVRRAGR